MPLFASMLAAALWGLFPVLTATATLMPGGDGLSFAVLTNIAGGLAALTAATLSARVAWHRVTGLLMRRPAVILLLVNAGCIAAANALAFHALAGEGRIASALVLDAWPLLAALILPAIVPGYSSWTRRRFPALVLAGAGFAAMHDLNSWPTQTMGLALLSTLAQVGTFCLHQRLISGGPARLDGWDLLAIQGVRMLLAAALAVPALLLLGDPLALIEPAAGTLATAGAAGATIALSALLSTWALERSRAPALALTWLLAPVLTVAALDAIDLDTLTPALGVAAGLICAALAWDQLVDRTSAAK